MFLMTSIYTYNVTFAGALNWLFRPLLPDLEPELGLEPVLSLLLCSQSS